MADADPLRIQRAVGAVLRGLKRARGEPLKPPLAIAALIEAMRARFDLPAEAASRMLSPALADWRDAVGCADPLLVPANAQGSSAEKALVPLPLPSWCAHLVDAGVLRLDGPPSIEGPRVVQHAHLEAIREAELAAVERFPFEIAGRFASGAASLHVHLAISPPFISDAWRGEMVVRAAAQRSDRSRAPVPLWIGAPSEPGAAGSGRAGETAVSWPSPRWPRWLVVRSLEGREPQALWDVGALWRARMGAGPEAMPGGAPSGAPVSMRVAVDIGSTSTLAIEEDAAGAGAVGGKLIGDPIRSGFRRLAGDPRTAHRFGCGERLLARSAQLPTALVAPGPRAVAELLAGSAEADQLWLPQAPPEDEAGGGAADPCLLVDRFKSPELLQLSEWPAAVASEAGLDLLRASRRLLETYGRLLGRTLAAAHGAPLVTLDGGSWSLRWPRLSSAEAVLTYPLCGFSAADPLPFHRVLEDVGRELCHGLSSAWPSASLAMVADPAAARAARDPSRDAGHPIEAFVDFGGLTLQITVRVPRAPGRPEPFIASSSTGYLLGGERLIDAAAFASADLDRSAALREAYRAQARKLRRLIAAGRCLEVGESGAGQAAREAILGVVFALVGRHLEGTLRRAAPDLTRLRGAGARLYLLGEGWKLVALDTPDERREEEAMRRIDEWLRLHPLSTSVAVRAQRMSKWALCEGALRVHGPSATADDPIELQGVDVASASGLLQRWFGIADPLAPIEPDASPHLDDGWWRSFAADGGDGSLLRVEQWFSAADSSSPFRARLRGGKMAFDSRRPLLKQWLDTSGPSLVALRIRDAAVREP